MISTVNLEMMCVFDVGLEYIITNWLSEEAAYNHKRLMLQDNNIKPLVNLPSWMGILSNRRDIEILIIYLNYYDTSNTSIRMMIMI